MPWTSWLGVPLGLWMLTQLGKPEWPIRELWIAGLWVVIYLIECLSHKAPPPGPPVSREDWERAKQFPPGSSF